MRSARRSRATRLSQRRDFSTLEGSGETLTLPHDIQIPPPGESLPPEEPTRAEDYGFTEDELEFLMENTIKPHEGRRSEEEKA